MEKKIITRRDAFAQGLTHYYTGKPCSNGHDSLRYTKNYNCVACDKEQCKLRNERLAKEVGEENVEAYLKEKWRRTAQKHRDKDPEAYREYIREYMRKYTKTAQGKKATRKARKRYYENKVILDV